ncbi:structural maintenance of chromosomes protein 4 [Diaporthe helianthi]|uniref:Structural maintenance of chromosomes protein 4 n=1 Tax=Diaporthe helianthi TaxID=158607 RepID=A0A2P5I6R0_DIAHE|nr:structural maintenance of chromosomes protein 4 [Diaporthe helianthi]
MSTRPTRRAAAKRKQIIESDDEDEIANSPSPSPPPEDEEDSEEEFTPAPPKSSRKSTGGRRKTIQADTPSASEAAPRRRGRQPRKSAAPSVPPDTTTVEQGESSQVADADQTIAPTNSAPRKRGRPKKQAIKQESVEPEASIQPSIEPANEPDENLEPVPENAVPDQTAMEVDQEETPVKKPGRKRKSVAPPASSSKKAPTPDVQQSPTPATPRLSKPSATPDPERFQTPLSDITNTAGNDQRRPIEDTLLNTSVKPIKPLDTVMEKPMDIVLKSRTMVIPQVEDTTPKPRLVITYLILTNFKSYSGRQEVGPFHSSFSSVVGPNGSGKSNVIDSLLFVFGFRASKMRQGKLSALIHNSADHPNLDFCEVAVHFQEVMDQPGGGHEVIPDSDLVISRKAFKNNSSSYYINGKTSSYTVVTTLLRDRGVDLDHKRFLILQGEVESIAQMKPKAANEHDDGLLEYLEDIIGTSKYKAPIEESATEVETLNEICMEKSGRVQHVEKEKNSLEDKKNKALAYLRDENELTRKQSALYQIYIDECNDNLIVTEEAITQIQAQLDEELEKHQGSEAIIKELQKKYSKGNKQYEAQDKETQALVKEMAKFDQERVKFDEKRKFLADKKKKLEKTITSAEKNSAEAEETIEQCGEDIETRGQEIIDLEEQVKEAESELAVIRESLKGKTQEFSDQIAAKQKSLEPWQEKINVKQSAIAVAESELNILREKANAGAVALKDMENKITSTEARRKEKEQELKSCHQEKKELEAEAQEVEAEIQELAGQEPKIRSKVSNSRQKADEARSSLSATQTQGNVLTALMRMKESGRIDGFHGRLGNLGAIDKKYDVAISTACGALDNFVTDTVEAGQQCIEYLRKTNMGRGNFICLDKLRSRDVSPIQTPEDAPRLFDLVQAKEEKFRAAFYHALQDTLVATDLAQANRIAYGARRWRVVTLDGELIDKSGTMSGGGNTKKKGLMSSKLVADTTKEQVLKLESDRDALEQKFQEFLEYQRECETRLRDLKNRIPQLETKMQKISLEIDSATKNLADAQRRIKELAKEHQPSKSDDSRITALEKEVKSLQKEVEKLRGETSTVEEEIKALQDRIMQVGGDKLRTQRAKVDGLKKEIASHNEETSKAEVKKAKAEKQKTKLAKDHAKATKELDVAIRDLENLEEEIANQGTKAEDFKTRVEEAQEGLAVKKQELAELKSELDEKTAELNATRASEIEMRNKLEENQKALAENQRKVKYWEDKHSKLRLQDIQDLETAAAPKAAAAAAAGNGSADNTQEGENPGEAGAEGEGAGDSDVEMTDAGDEEEADGDAEVAEEEVDTTIVRDRKIQKTLPRYSKDELEDMNKETLKGEIAALEEKTQNVNVDLGVLAEYRRRVEEHAARSSDLQTAVTQRDTAKKRCDELRRLRLEGFMEGFSMISLRLKEMYQMITMGGNAELELVDSLDPFSEGILFSVMPPKKSWKNISNLSGGEKTLSSLALVFALHHYKPTPLYVMDEIDAALDFRNVSIVANYIKERTKNAQFIVISLRNNMFELAARLVGVYKVNHMTKSVSIENRDYIRGRQPRPQQVQQLGGGATQQQTVNFTLSQPWR